MKQNLKKQFGIFLLKKRNEKNITQKELSSASGVTRATIVKIEAGENNTSLESTYKIINALGSNFSDFQKFLDENSIKKQLESQIENSFDIEKLLATVKG